jgi:hypothetical protein
MKYILLLAITFLASCSSATDESTLKDTTTPSWMDLPLMVHTNNSERWNESNLDSILSFVQYTYNQAYIRIVPTFTDDSAYAEGMLDLVFQPAVYYNGARVNGYSIYFKDAKVEDYCDGSTPAIPNVPLMDRFNTSGAPRVVNLDASEACVALVAAHEIGHGVGLDHLGSTLMRFDISSAYQKNLTTSQIATARLGINNHFNTTKRENCKIEMRQDPQNRGNGKLCALTSGSDILSSWFDADSCTAEIIADLKNDAKRMCENVEVTNNTL